MPDRLAPNRPLLRPRDSVSTTLRALLDGLAVIVLTWVATTAHNDGRFSVQYAVLLLVLLGAMGVFYDRFGVYREHGSFFRQTTALFKAWTAGFALLLALAFVTKETATYSRLVLTNVFVWGLLAQVAIHLAFRVLHGALKSDERSTRALIVGTGALADQLYYRVQDNPWIQEKIVGAVSVDPDAAQSQAPSGRLRVLGGLDDVVRLVDALGVRTVYLAIDLDAAPVIQKVYFELLDRNVNVHWVPNIFALQLVNHSVGELAGLPVITLSETPLIGTRRLLKAVEDKVLASLLLLLVSPVMLLAALAVKLESPGPVFFRQARTGWDGRVFRIWKFRSMREHAPETGTVQQATRDDPRVTRVGRFLRRSSIDELPQLFNVLTGDMSLVGPRPHAVEHNVEYAHKITAYLARHRIKPGITGLAQVRGLRGETKDVTLMARRVQADLEYINSWSIWLDLTILARTVFVAVGRNAY